MQVLIVTFMLAAAPLALCLDSNIIRSSKELMEPQQTGLSPERDTVDISALNIMRRRQNKQSRPDCSPDQINECRGSKKRQGHGGKMRLPLDERVRGKVSEMGECLRSRDCEEGLCCARYLTGRRCQRVPKEGDACPLRSRSKSRRNQERCDCERGLQCHAESHGSRVRGVCHA